MTCSEFCTIQEPGANAGENPAANLNDLVGSSSNSTPQCVYEVDAGGHYELRAVLPRVTEGVAYWPGGCYLDFYTFIYRQKYRFVTEYFSY